MGPHTVLPIAISCPEVFSWISSMVWNLLPFKGDFSFRKSQKSQGAKSDYREAESLGWFDVLPKNCRRHDTWADVLSWCSCQSPVAHSCSLLEHFHRAMLRLNAKSDADLLLYSLSDFECDNHTVHMLTQWHLLPPLASTMKSSLFTHAHSSPLSLDAMLHRNHSLYINNGWAFPGQTLYTSHFKPNGFKI